MKKAVAKITVEDIAPALRTFVRPIESLKPDPDNENVHTDDGLATLKHSLVTHGQQTPVVIDKDGVIKKGHLTVKAATELGWQVIAASEYHKDGSKAAQYRIADNKIATYSMLDPDILAKTITEAIAAGVDPINFGFAELDAEALLNSLNAGVDFDELSDPEKAKIKIEKETTCPNCGHTFK